MKREKDLTCDDCGIESEDVTHGFCPYCQDIHNEEVEVDLCPDCYHERCMDI